VRIVPEAWAGKDRWALRGHLPVSYISRAQLLANKRATGSMTDIADLEGLGEA